MKQFLLAIAFFMSLGMCAQYNSDYIQYMFNGLLVNPAYAGGQGALNVTAMYRKQWVGLNGAPDAAILSIHSPLKNKRLNLGAVLNSERFGVYNHTNAGLIYAYRFPCLRGKLSLGVQGGIDAYSTNWGRIQTTDAGDPNFEPNGTRNINPAVGAGAYYYSELFYLGFSALNLYTDGLNKGFTGMMTSGVLLKAGDDIRIKPAVLVKHLQGAPLVINLSSTFYYRDAVGLGIGYTYKNSALAYIDLKLSEQLNIGYGYSYMLNALNNYSSGSHEIMLRYLFRYKIKAVSARYF